MGTLHHAEQQFGRAVLQRDVKSLGCDICEWCMEANVKSIEEGNQMGRRQFIVVMQGNCVLLMRRSSMCFSCITYGWSYVTSKIFSAD